MMIPVDLYVDIILNHNLLEYPFALYFYKRNISTIYMKIQQLYMIAGSSEHISRDCFRK